MPLVLTRKIRQSFIIGNEIKVTLVSINGSQARISINAPREIPVYREELIDEENNQQQKGVQQCHIN